MTDNLAETGAVADINIQETFDAGQTNGAVCNGTASLVDAADRAVPANDLPIEDNAEAVSSINRGDLLAAHEPAEEHSSHIPNNGSDPEITAVQGVISNSVVGGSIALEDSTSIDDEKRDENHNSVEVIDSVGADETNEASGALDAIDLALEGEKQSFSSDSESSSSSESSSDSDDGQEDESDSALAEQDETEKRKGDLSDDEDSSGPLRTKNEIIDEKAPTVPSDFRLTGDMPIEYVGDLIQVVEKTAVIKAAISGEYRVLAEGSIFCFEDRNLLGVLYETFGRVQQPMYSVKFNTAEETEAIASLKGRKVYYIVPVSSFVFTEAVRQVKGSDASNLHDEEVPEDEQEFSDDEKEAEFKTRRKRPKKKNLGPDKNKAFKTGDNRPNRETVPKETREPRDLPPPASTAPSSQLPTYPVYPNASQLPYPSQMFYGQPQMPWLPPQYSPQQFVYGGQGFMPQSQLLVPVPSNSGSLPPPTNSGHIPAPTASGQAHPLKDYWSDENHRYNGSN
jgi:H/ACA ribonucleoprotein complex non-core subunit NAF1